MNSYVWIYFVGALFIAGLTFLFLNGIYNTNQSLGPIGLNFFMILTVLALIAAKLLLFIAAFSISARS